MKQFILFITFITLVSCVKEKATTPVEKTVIIQRACSVSKEGLITTIKCPDGTESQIVDGAPGKDGQDCYVEAINAGANIVCGGSIVTVEDGINGTNGIDGISPILEIIDPCGDKPGKFDEIVLKLSENQLVVYFQSGSNYFLTLLTPGNYRTTDEQKCYFTVNGQYQIINERL
jgi:hypothetical protein